MDLHCEFICIAHNTHMRSIIALLALLLSFAILPPTTNAATYYLGAFKGSTPLDDADCGAGKQAHPRSHPCATLEHWTRTRRGVLAPGDVIRLAPGVYAKPGSTNHCILLDAHATGVTYEGRTATDDDLGDRSEVVLDLDGVSDETRTNPCLGRGVTNLSDCAAPFHDVTIRHLTIANAPGRGVEVCGTSANHPNGIVLDDVRVMASKRRGGMSFGRFDNGFGNADRDCVNGGRTVTGLTVRASEVDHNHGFPGGILLACMDGAVIERTNVHDNCDMADCKRDCVNVPPGCDDRDGITMAGAIHVAVRDSEIYNTGEDGIDVGGHPLGKSHDVLIERTAAHDSQRGNFKISGGRYVTIRNSYSWGQGFGYASYGCPHHIHVYNNTFWNDGRAMQLYEYQTKSKFINNILRGADGSPPTTVSVDEASTNRSNIWMNNIVIHDGTGTAIAEYQGQQIHTPACDGWDHSHLSYDEAHDCRLGFAPPPVPCPRGEPASPPRVEASSVGLAIFQANGHGSQWFGPNSGAGDRWGTAPLLVNPTEPSVKNLHIAAGDEVAIDHGRALPAVTVDIDGDRRPQGAAWDIGADEFTRGPLP